MFSEDKRSSNTEAWCNNTCPQLLHQGKISPWPFSIDAIFCFLQCKIRWNHRRWAWYLWWVWFLKLMFLVPLSYRTSCCLVAWNTVGYCWRISFSWWSKLTFLISSCSCCCPSNDKLLLLHWLLTSSLTVSQFWKFSIFWFAAVSEGGAGNFSITSVMPNHSFMIVYLYLPSFLGGRVQLMAAEVNENQTIASVRIHVERDIKD